LRRGLDRNRTFEKALETSPTWLQISPHLPEEGRRYILKGVHTAFRDRMFLNNPLPDHSFPNPRPIPLPNNLLWTAAKQLQEQSLKCVSREQRARHIPWTNIGDRRLIDWLGESFMLASCSLTGLSTVTGAPMADIPVAFITSPTYQKHLETYPDGGAVCHPVAKIVVIFAPFRWQMQDLTHQNDVRLYLYQALLHEVTHAIDVLPEAPKHALSRSEYMAQPHEWRGYLQNVLLDTLMAFPGQLYIQENRRRAFDVAFQEGRVWRKIEPDLPEEGRRYILQATYQAFVDMMLL
jgi:hypothetical protein